MLYRTIMKTPVGQLTLVASDAGLREVRLPLPNRRARTSDGAAPADNHSVLQATRRQLDEYFRGERTDFEIPTDAEGTPFQQEVWSALVAIPYGVTESYGELAERVGRPGAARAVGGANGRNPLPIVVPCHRVIGASGAMTGYAGPDESGIAIKRWLLKHEGAVID